MLIRTYLQPVIRALLAGSIITLGYATFGVAEYFDRIYLILIAVLLIYFYQNKQKNIDIIGILIIMLVGCLIDEIAYTFMHSPYIKTITYSLSAIALYHLKRDDIATKLGIPLFVLTLFSEVYWYTTQYPPPVVHYSMALIMVNLLMRDFFMLRFAYTINRLKVQAHITDIDYVLYNICKYVVFVISAMLIEYLIRHLTPLNPLFIYNIYPFLQHGLLVFFLVILIDYVYKIEITLKA